MHFKGNELFNACMKHICEAFSELTLVLNEGLPALLQLATRKVGPDIQKFVLPFISFRWPTYLQVIHI